MRTASAHSPCLARSLTALSACGAVIGTLTHYDDTNAVHRRLKANLGAANFEYLSKNQVILADGTNITYVIGAAIIVLQGMLDTCQALAESELDEVRTVSVVSLLGSCD